MASTDRIVFTSPAGAELTLAVEHDETRFSIALFGELDLATAPELETVLARAEGSGAAEIVIDLAGLEFMDSSGIGLLVRAARRSARNGSRLRLRRGRGQVERVMTLCRLHERLPFAD